MDSAINYGLIFKDGEDDVWLGKYNNGTIRDFGALTDSEGVYEDLPMEKFAFVKYKESENDRLLISDISTFEIGKSTDHGENEIEPKHVTEMLEAMNFPSEDSDNMFRSFLNAAGKAN